MSKKPNKISIVGGGLAGSEAAWQALKAGFAVDLYEMRPELSTAAHKTGQLAELVCSNSLKSMQPESAPGRLKAEMGAFESLILKAAAVAKVPAGQALAVDREVFSNYIKAALDGFPGFRRIGHEVSTIPSSSELEAENSCWLIASGPLTSPPLAKALEDLTGGKRRLFFYDAIAPVLAADSVDMNHAFRASRYGRDGHREPKRQGATTEGSSDTPLAATARTAVEAGPDTGEDEEAAGDYLNLPMNKAEYEAFIDALLTAEYMPLHAFEDTNYFEACLPVEVMVERGRETLRFGPMKPVGLTDPRTGHRPWANVQLRLENTGGTMYSMVGFQTKMKWPEQKRVFGLIPALKDAEFLRYGSVHRNTYMRSPEVLNPDLSFKASPRVFLAGQISGVEGYTESAAMGLLAARAAVAKANGGAFTMPPQGTIIGALVHYVTHGGLGDFQPMNANLGLLPHLDRQRGESKVEKKARQCALAQQRFAAYWQGSMDANQ